MTRLAFHTKRFERGENRGIAPSRPSIRHETADEMAPWKGLTGVVLAAWLLGAGCLVASAIVYVTDYDRFRWPLIPVLTMTAGALNLFVVTPSGDKPKAFD